MSLCAMLTFSDQHKAAWIFLTAPLESIRSFVRGIFWSLVIPLAVVAFLLLPFYIRYWGVRDALLFLIYSLSLEYVLCEHRNVPGRRAAFL